MMVIDTGDLEPWVKRNFIWLIVAAALFAGLFDGGSRTFVSPAKESLLGRRVPIEAFAPAFDGHARATCDRTPAGWLRISGRLLPGDGFTHAVVVKCVDNCDVVIIRDQPDSS